MTGARYVTMFSNRFNHWHFHSVLSRNFTTSTQSRLQFTTQYVCKWNQLKQPSETKEKWGKRLKMLSLMHWIKRIHLNSSFRTFTRCSWVIRYKCCTWFDWFPTDLHEPLDLGEPSKKKKNVKGWDFVPTGLHAPPLPPLTVSWDKIRLFWSFLQGFGMFW